VTHSLRCSQGKKALIAGVTIFQTVSQEMEELKRGLRIRRIEEEKVLEKENDDNSKRVLPHGTSADRGKIEDREIDRGCRSSGKGR